MSGPLMGDDLVIVHAAVELGHKVRPEISGYRSRTSSEDAGEPLD